MAHTFQKLLAIAGEPIGGPVGGTEFANRWGALGRELAELLQLRNGFYAYESALLVRPLHHDGAPLGLLQWNDQKLWKANYSEDVSKSLFFAEDVFGGQYCFRDGAICTFDPETESFEEMSSSLASWAEAVMADYQFRTGYPLAHAWRIGNAPLQPGMRLLPKVPFVLGGKYEVENLYTLGDVEGMQVRALIANQIRELPDGAEIILNADDSEEPPA